MARKQPWTQAADEYGRLIVNWVGGGHLRAGSDRRPRVRLEAGGSRPARLRASQAVAAATVRRGARGFEPTIRPVPSSQTGVPKISAAQPIGPISEHDCDQDRERRPPLRQDAVRKATTAMPTKNGISANSAPTKNMSPMWCSVPAVAALMLSWLIAAARSPAWIKHAEDGRRGSAGERERRVGVRTALGVGEPRPQQRREPEERRGSRASRASRREMIGFWFPWIQVRSCASVGWCGILSLNELMTTRPAIQSATARTAGRGAAAA